MLIKHKAAAVPPDYSLYLVTDRDLAKGRAIVDVVRAAVAGGVTVVQLREKTAPTRFFIEQAEAVRGFLKNTDVAMIINDRVDVALAVGADGVHLGQTDMPLAMARAILGPDRIIGISVESVDDALQAAANGADYLGVSPVFATPTKTDTAVPLGLDGLARIRQAVDLPLVGIGGISAANAANVIQAGADGLAVVSAIVGAEDPEAAARNLVRAIREARHR
jgi:thiamine-phosphate pyrophosphorylase